MSIDLPKPIAPIFAAAPAAKMLPYSCQAGETGGLPPHVIFTEPPTCAATPKVAELAAAKEPLDSKLSLDLSVRLRPEVPVAQASSQINSIWRATESATFFESPVIIATRIPSR